MIEQTKPCYVVRCDSCMETLGYDEYDATHFETEGEAREQADAAGWSIDPHGDIECHGCADNRKAEAAFDPGSFDDAVRGTERDRGT